MFTATSQDGSQPDLMEAIIASALGPKDSGIRAQITLNALQRGNTPSRGVKDKLVTEGPPRQDGTLWIVDRIIEPQTIVHFIQSAVMGTLPGGRTLTLPVLDDETIICLTTPPSTWAPAPYNTKEMPYIEDIMGRIGSNEDSARLQVISKDLQFAKSRLWEGIPPLSQRRWDERELDHPSQFPVACQLITSALEVFHYLQTPQVAWALRETYNLIFAHLVEFQQAMNAKFAAEGKPSVQVARLWAEFMTAQFAMMENVAHSWCTEHIAVLKKRCLETLRAHQPSAAAGGNYDEVQWALTNMWQDLVENQAQADFGIFIPMDGYAGANRSSATKRPTMTEEQAAVYAGTTPLKFCVGFDNRLQAYHKRRRQLDLLIMMNEMQEKRAKGERTPQRSRNDPAWLAEMCQGQDRPQTEARKELRGDPPVPGQAVWIAEAKGKILEVVVYRAHYDLKDEEWNWFVEMFEEDVRNWGGGLVDAEEVRKAVKIVWRDVRSEGVTADFDGLNKHYNTDRGNDTQGFYLVADKFSVDSYLSPPNIEENPTSAKEQPRNLPGDIAPSILAFDPDFDRTAEPDDRSAESPGFDGTVRICPSLIVDDILAGHVTQSQGLAEIWPSAMHHPQKVYGGPVTRAQLQAWGVPVPAIAGHDVAFCLSKAGRYLSRFVLI